MKITARELPHVELLSISGRVDSVEAARLAQTLKAAQDRGRYKLLIDLGGLEYMSSAGFRALAIAQRNSRRDGRGEVVLTQVPIQVREAMEIVGFTDYFRIIEPSEGAIQYLENLPPTAGAAKGSKPDVSRG